MLLMYVCLESSANDAYFVIYLIRPVVVYGGTSLGYQMRQVENGANFVIGTPGRLLDIINRGKVSGL